MSTKIIGYDKKDGTFTNKNTGEVVPYSNRLLKLITNDAESDTTRGWSGYEEKAKTSDIARTLGVADDSIEVDKILDNLINGFKEVHVLRTPINNVLTCVGIIPVNPIK